MADLGGQHPGASGVARGKPLVDRRYRVLEQLGRGATGAVFRVLDTSTEREVALKRLVLENVRASRRTSAQLRFRREFHTMAGLAHPRIVDVYDYGVDDEGAWYTMELLDGSDLSDVGTLAAPEACRILRDVASALAFLHGRRLLHRDIAPRNVRRTADGRAKLIDFGVLATMGVAREVAGTPPCIPPEAARGLPLDARADLFGLGALAYWALTGRHAYPARVIDELEGVWARRPAPLSVLRPDLPAALDALVMSLLSLDPLARPSNAAEVIDRLTGIGELEPEETRETARGWLQSASLVGRQEEIARTREIIHDALRGSGRAFLIEAPSGMGKSRLLREAGLEAQIAGATVLRAGGQVAARGAFGVLRELVAGLLEVCAADAIETARAHIEVIGRVLPELHQRIPNVRLARAGGDPGEDRMRMQERLLAWFRDLSRRRPLVLLVDDIQRCDEGSAAFLASLAHSAADMRVVVVGALRTDEDVRAAAAIAAMLDAGDRVRLRGLEPDEVTELVRALFGDVPHADRLAQFVHRSGGGSPLHCTELARHLVDRGTVRYLDGVWTIAGDLEREELPRALSEAMEARVRALGPRARELGEALAVQGGELPLELVVPLADAEDEADVFVALDELVFEEVLLGDGESYRFRHDGLREALLRLVAPERRRRLHLRAAQALASAGEVGPEREAEVGWHFLHGGDSRRASRFLANAGRRLYEAHSFRDAIGCLEAALEIIERERAPVRVSLELRTMLMRAGVLCDRDVILRYADETIAAYRRAGGLDVAERLGRVVGGRLALVLGVAWAFFRRLLSRPRNRLPGPTDALAALIALVNFTASARSLSFDLARLPPLIDLLRPVAAMRGRLGEGAYLLARNFLLIPIGAFAEVHRNSLRMLEILDRDHLTPITEIDRRMARGAAHYMRASVSALDQDPSYQNELEHLEKLDLRFFEAAATMARLFYHRLRGEEEIAARLADRTEMLVVQLGNVWVFESQLSWISAIAYGVTRDVLALRRSVETLERLVELGYQVDAFAALARGEYLRERSDLEGARQALERALALTTTEEAFARQMIYGALAETYLAANDLDRARGAAEAGLALATDPELGCETARMRCGRALALTIAAGGDHVDAARRLEALIAEAERRGSPSVCGSLHEARARVALAAADIPGFQHHAHEADRWFRATMNPALIARSERLAEARTGSADASVRISIVSDEAVTAVERTDPRGRITRALRRCRGARERATRSLEMIVDECSASRGWLFLAAKDGLQLAAPLLGQEPPDAVVEAAERTFDAVRAASTKTAEEAQAAAGTEERESFLTVLLSADLEDRQIVAGVVIVAQGSLPLRKPDPRLPSQIARTLHEAGDVTDAREQAAAAT